FYYSTPALQQNMFENDLKTLVDTTNCKTIRLRNMLSVLIFILCLCNTLNFRSTHIIHAYSSTNILPKYLYLDLGSHYVFYIIGITLRYISPTKFVRLRFTNEIRRNNSRLTCQRVIRKPISYILIYCPSCISRLLITKWFGADRNADHIALHYYQIDNNSMLKGLTEA
ncbi:hypothetical protein L9F63_017410, partial [Diploptera punctata]